MRAERPAAGLAAVLEAHRGALLRFVAARGAPDPEDVLQELWIKVFVEGGGPIQDPLAYLYRCANNLTLDRRRSELRSMRRDTEWVDTAGVGAEATDAATPERILGAALDLQAASQTLAELGERTDDIFRRFRLNGATQREIAGEFGLSVSAVEKHLQKAYRALLQLKERLNAE